MTANEQKGQILLQNGIVIYKAEGVFIDFWPYKEQMQGDMDDRYQSFSTGVLSGIAILP